MRTMLSAALLCLFATLSQAAGFKIVQIPADANGPGLKAMVWTPCAAPSLEVAIGPYVLIGRRDCPTEGDKLPLVVFSHGFRGSYLGHVDLAETLADAGFVVAAINHPGDTFNDMSRASEMSVFIERPTDIKRLIDYMLNGAADAARIDPARIGFFGFSRGGFTGLALAGGEPDFLNANLPCPDPRAPVCSRTQLEQIPKGAFAHDARIKAYVLADPLDAFPTAATLAQIKAPIQLWASEFGGDGVLPEKASAIAAALPEKPEFHRVAGAAHFAFLAPCSAELTKEAPLICIDANGFDRVAFHKEFAEKALAFFRATLR